MIRILPEATAELQETVDYYEGEQPGLGVRFVNRFEAAVNQVHAEPAMYSPLGQGYRKYGLRPFPYAVIYRIEHDTIVIVAVMHQRRKPDYWRDRA